MIQLTSMNLSWYLCPFGLVPFLDLDESRFIFQLHTKFEGKGSNDRNWTD